MNSRFAFLAVFVGTFLLVPLAYAAPQTGTPPSEAPPAGAPAARKAPMGPAGEYTAEEKAEINELLEDAKRFSGAAKTYRKTVNTIVKRVYKKRHKEMMAKYEKQIREEEAEERIRRIAAITLFEDFLRRYPNDKRWTPDVIFRLAELYFGKAHDEYLQAEERYQKRMAAYEESMRRFEKTAEGKAYTEALKAFSAALKMGEKPIKPVAPSAIPVPPSSPKQNYNQTISLHRQLIRDFPRYRLIDGAYYLLGFCLSEMAKENQGNQAYLSLACANRFKPPLEDKPDVVAPAAEGAAAGLGLGPGGTGLPVEGQLKPSLNVEIFDDCQPLSAASRFIAEAWIRIGEFHFDENQFGEAIASYNRVIKLGPTKNAYYDEALYKLAWTYYRADRFTEAIKHFDQLVVYADREYERTGKYGSEMRPESIQYLAISFAEEDWDGDTVADTETGMERIEKFYGARTKEKHVYEVYKRLGDIYFDMGTEKNYADAVKVYKLILDRWPFRPDNPDMQDKVILALERQREFEKAMAEREEFTRRFGKGTEWERKNKDNTKALKKAQEYDEQALIQAAVFHHKRGQEVKKRGMAMNDINLLQNASKEYALAAKAYEKYLERFPNTKNSYEIKFSYAMCLYFSQRFMAAGKAFEEVRDSNLDNRYLEEAAFSAIKAYEETIAGQVQAGKLANPVAPKASEPPASLTPLPMPEIYTKWIKAMDIYAKLLPKSAKTPRLVYKAAETMYRFLNFEDARKRFGDIFVKYCQDPMAINAGQAVLVTYLLEKNMDKQEEWAIKLKAGKCGGTDAKVATTAEGATKLLAGIHFKRAQELMAKQDWDKAAVAFIALVDKNPKSGDSDKALNNAAVCFERSKRFESATKIYERIWQQYPKSEFADEALWRTAINYQRFFEFNKAVNNFLILADSPRFASSTHRVDSIYNAALILENDQAYSRAAQLFLRYASAKGTTKEAADAYFKAGEIYEKKNNYGQMVKIFREFPRLYASVPKQAARVVEGYFKIAKAARKRNSTRDMIKYYKITMNEFTMKGLAPASDAAEYAANAAFELAERKLTTFLKNKIKGAISTIPRKEEKMAKQALALKQEYESIWAYKRARWTLAAMARSGTIYEFFGRTMDGAYRNAPIPKKVKKLGDEAIFMYQDQVDALMRERVDPIFAMAKKLYKSCVDKAKQMGVSNKYTEEAHRKLSAFDPVAYPLLKRAKVETSID